MVAPRTIFTEDNLPILRGMNDKTIDLVYLDPPFNSKRQYSAPIGSAAAGAEFKDTWTEDDIKEEWHAEVLDRNPALYGIIDAVGTIQNYHAGKKRSRAKIISDKAYLIYMATRLIEIHRILKDTGSVYLHCDPTMSHALKLVLDSIFGQENFRNEIIWHYTGGGRSKTYFSKKHDIILWYSKGAKFTFNIDAVRIPYAEGSGYAKSGIKAKSGKVYKPNPLGTPVDDVWDIPIINPLSDERTGYPTQKPLELLRRIVRASSNRGDLVLDPFCGCATTCIASEDEGREWIGIDISPKAFDLVKQRMGKELGMFGDVTNRTDIPIRKAPKPSKDIKITLYGTQGGNCAGCNTHFDHVRHFEIDHIIARSRGGADTDSNLQLLCGNCNRLKGDKPMEYLKAKLRSFGAI